MARLGLVLLLVAHVAAAGPKKSKHAAIKHATSRFQTPDDASDAPAVRYASLTPEACKAELAERHIEYREETAKGVLDPGPAHRPAPWRRRSGPTCSETQRETTPWEIADCRLVLALDDFAAMLEKHDIVEVRHYSIYRVAAEVLARRQDRRPAQRRRSRSTPAASSRRTARRSTCSRTFHGKIGDKTCGDGAGPHPATAEAKELRAILCDAVDAHLFNVVLTPDFNRPHRNHFHLEVMAGVKWFLVH